MRQTQQHAHALGRWRMTAQETTNIVLVGGQWRGTRMMPLQFVEAAKKAWELSVSSSAAASASSSRSATGHGTAIR